MARVTISDCLRFVANRFELVWLASKRAHELSKGASPLIPVDQDKPTVIALREIANGLHYNPEDPEQARYSIIEDSGKNQV